MSALLLLLAAAAAPHKGAAWAVSPAGHKRELALKAKMETWRGEWRIEPKGVACKAAKTTGDARLDAIGCRAIQVCYAPKVPQVAEIEDGASTDEEKKARLATLLGSAKTCVARNRALAIEIIAGTRLPPAAVVKPARDVGR